ncbi:hypothetical protein [Buchnera aphidicola]|jgi:sulfate adenylyltransferase subunit 1
MHWYKGFTLLHLLETIKIENTVNSEEIRFPIQYINRPNSNFRGYSGTLFSGKIHIGQKIKILPININSCISRIAKFDQDLETAEVGGAITIVLNDEIDINRGDFFVNINSFLKPSQEAIIDVVWMIDSVLEIGNSYIIKLSGKKRVFILKKFYLKLT